MSQLPSPGTAGRFDLKFRIYFFHLVLLVAVMAVATWLEIGRQRTVFHRRLERKVHTLAKALEPFLPGLVDRREIPALENLVKKLTSADIAANEILSVAILDPRLQELAFSHRTVPDRDRLTMTQPATDVFRCPIRVPGRPDPALFLLITFSTEELIQLRLRLISGNVGVTLIFAALAFAWAWLLASTINRPLRHLVEAADRLAAGQIGANLEERGHDEIGILVGSFNRMTAAITVHLEELRSKNLTLDKRVYELSTLHQATRAINSVLNLDQLYECIVDTTISVMGGVKRCSLLLVDRRAGEFVIKVAKGLDVGVLPRNRRVPITSGIAGRVFASGESAIINDVDQEGDSRLLESTSVVRSSLVVPLKRNEEVIGILSVGNRISGEPFHGKDQGMLESLAVQAGIAIKNAKLYQDLSRKILELNTLHEVGKSLSMVLELEKLLEMILDMTARVLGGVKASSLILYDEESGLLQVKVYKGNNPQAARRPIKLGEGIAGKVFERGEPLMINNLAAETEEGESLPTLVKEGVVVRSSLCVPLKIKECTIGVLSVSDKLSGDNFDDNDLHMLVTLASQIAITLNNARLYEDLEASYLSAVRALANSLDAKDPYTRGHSERVALYSLEIGRKMNLSPDELKTLHIGALLHDIGKIGISESIINKTSRLTEEEFDLIRTHPVRGASIIEPAKFLKNKVPLIRYHHERFDGQGYPEGLKGDGIPMLARIVCVADSYDAMTSKRAYREPMGREAAMKELIKCSGSQFDAKVVTSFLEVLSDDKRMLEIEQSGET
jgi:HD-GYP domain-containing protein (c-di-GMP phosphodiesterase class II)/HAMP domain-containing protein